MNIHFVYDKVNCGEVCVMHVLSHNQINDIFIKGLLLQVFDDFKDSINIRQPRFDYESVFDKKICLAFSNTSM